MSLWCDMEFILGSILFSTIVMNIGIYSLLVVLYARTGPIYNGPTPYKQPVLKDAIELPKNLQKPTIDHVPIYLTERDEVELEKKEREQWQQMLNL